MRRTELGRVHMVKSVLPISNPPIQNCTRVMHVEVDRMGHQSPVQKKLSLRVGVTARDCLVTL